MFGMPDACVSFVEFDLFIYFWFSLKSSWTVFYNDWECKMRLRVYNEDLFCDEREYILSDSDNMYMYALMQ